MNVEVRFTRGYDEFFHSWSGNVGRFVRRNARTVEYQQKSLAPVRSGALKRSIGTWYGRFNGELEARVGANPAPGNNRVGYALYMQKGTRPHVIRPRQAKALRFVMNGQVVYAAKVNHPGTRPRPYLTLPLRNVFR